ncbi:hypothetical protein BV25DRAFT_626098 [Artomyces pyxidatus]|uniref:Uncharacterized protein n=1 Tax=Artomyces pyxidatus TaxID=48021 RepID=A0ACB8T0W8_9AGAM|nr:hypothetical protein BV25DRAFT_626098 [Artomyces pyxidatus]
MEELYVNNKHVIRRPTKNRCNPYILFSQLTVDYFDLRVSTPFAHVVRYYFKGFSVICMAHTSLLYGGATDRHPSRAQQQMLFFTTSLLVIFCRAIVFVVASASKHWSGCPTCEPCIGCWGS